MKAWFVRWQEHVGWLPLALVGVMLSYVVVGAVDRTAVTDVLNLVVELFIRNLYAVSWLSMVYLARRRFRRKLSAAEQTQLWQAAMRSERGPLILVALDALIWIVAGLALLPFYYLAH